MPDFLNAVVDISHWDRDVDFQAVAGSGVLGIMQKATQGQLDIDPTYAGNRIKATQAGLLWGAYHFAPATRVSARRSIFSQSSAIIAMYCWRLDFEQNPTGPSMDLEQARAFVTHVYAQTGRYPGLYGGSYLKKPPRGRVRSGAYAMLVLDRAVRTNAGQRPGSAAEETVAILSG
jgi:lysozyme